MVNIFFKNRRLYINILIDAMLLSSILCLLLFTRGEKRIGFYLPLIAVILFLCFIRYYIFDVHMFGLVRMNSHEIKDSKTLIEWNNVKRITVENTYFRIKSLSVKGAGFFADIGNYDAYIGKSYCIYDANGNKISLSRTKRSLKCILKHAPEFYQELTCKREKQSNVRFVFGNLKLFCILVLLSLIPSVLVLIFIYESFPFVAIGVCVSLFLFFFKASYMRFLDALTVTKISNEGITRQGNFVKWEEINKITFHDSSAKVMWFTVKLGMLICVNADYSDEYFGKHSTRCIYVSEKHTARYFKEHSALYRRAVEDLSSRYSYRN